MRRRARGFASWGKRAEVAPRVTGWGLSRREHRAGESGPRQASAAQGGYAMRDNKTCRHSGAMRSIELRCAIAHLEIDPRVQLHLRSGARTIPE